MRSLLDDLRDAATPIQLGSRSGLIAAVKAAQVALISAMTERQAGSSVDDTQRGELRRYANWLEYGALDTPFEGEDVDVALNLAATLFEFIGRLEPCGSMDIFSPPTNDLLHSSLLASMTSYSAQAVAATARVLESFHSPPLNASPAELLHFRSIRAALRLLLRDFEGAFAEGLRVEELIEAVSQGLSKMPLREAFRLDLVAAVGVSAREAALGLMVGSPLLTRSARERLSITSSEAEKRSDGDAGWIARRLNQVIAEMQAANVFTNLRGTPAQPLARVLAGERKFELWRPQLEAIRKGLLQQADPPHMVISIPTGAGKTLIAELAIVAAVQSDDDWAIYITPSRALVSQVSTDLRQHLRHVGITVRSFVGGAEQSGFFDEEAETLTTSRTVSVMTPEKFDAYFRNDRSLFSTCKLIVVDEAHKLGEPGRGSVLESLITRVLLLQPRTRLVLLSGVMSNAADLVSWLDPDATELVVEQRRPTRQVRGLAVRHDEEPRDERIDKDGRRVRTVDYRVGLLIVHGAEDLRGVVLRPQLPGLLGGHFKERLSRRRWLEEGSGKTTNTQHAVELAAILSGSPGSTLVFLRQVRSVERAAKDIQGTFQPAKECTILADYLIGELDAQHSLVAAVRRGVAYHHAKLPSNVQRAVEFGLDRGWLKVVFATPTLREGINSAASNVVVAGHTYFDEATEEQVPIRAADFENLAGRAGRPFRESDGFVVLIPNSLAMASATGVGREYFLAGDEALRARSQLRELAERLDGTQGNTLQSFSLPDQSTLLGLLAAGIDDREDLEDFFAQSLCAVQDDEFQPSTTAHRCARIFKRTRELSGEDHVRVAARTGLSLSSSDAIRASLAPHVREFASKRTDEDRLHRLLPLLTAAALQAGEVRRGSLSVGAPSAHVSALQMWISGRSYGDILEQAVEDGVLKKTSALGDAVKYCADLGTWLSWGMGACSVLIQSEVEECDPWVAVVPLLVRYGVSTREAAHASLLGVTDRRVAERIGRDLAESADQWTMSTIASWLDRQDARLTLGSIGQLYSTSAGSTSFTSRARYFRTRIEPTSEVTIGEPYRLSVGAKRATSPLLIDRAGRVVGKVLAEQGELADFFQSELDLLSVVVTSIPQRGNPNVVILQPSPVES